MAPILFPLVIGAKKNSGSQCFALPNLKLNNQLRVW
jgi:hypothetical protein